MMYYNEELILRYESLIGRFNKYFKQPIQISDKSIKLLFSNSKFCLEFIKYFLKDFHSCRLTNNNKNFEIKILNLYTIEKLLKDISFSLEKSMINSIITINRNCYYGK